MNAALYSGGAGKHMKTVSTLIFVILVISFISCDPEEEQINTSQGLQLAFSDDTVLFDTLLTIRPSITRRLRIFNPNPKAVEVSSIRLGKGGGSDYTLIANGKSGIEIADEIIYGGDSILVLLTVDIDSQDQDLPYLVKDSLIVEWNQNRRDIKLVAYGQDANYLNGAVICDEIWTADRPYVIRNFAFVEEGCILTMEKGTRVYFDNGASFFVEGTLEINGDSADRVTIRNTRFDESYLHAPGQWGGIIFLETSSNNRISFADIENGDIGIGVGYTILEADGQAFFLPENSENTVDIQIDHTSIRHMSTAGILAFSSEVYAYNTEVYNVASWLVANFGGGDYRYEHCTFSNESSLFVNEDPMVQFSDNLTRPDEVAISGDLNITVLNSIIWGKGEEQLVIHPSVGKKLTERIESNIIRSAEPLENNFTSQKANFPGFKDPFSFDYRLDTLAFAKDKGASIGIETDILGLKRDSQPDIGAYERIELP